MVNQYMPKTLLEALDYLDLENCYIMAGGTDLMVQKHITSGVLPGFEKPILYLNHVEELNYIEEDETGLHIGSGAKIVDIQEDERVPKLLRDVLLELASPQIRNIATMAGNVCNASPVGDSIVPLYVLDARILIVSKTHKRWVKIIDFIKGVRKIDLDKGELVKEIYIPNQKFSKTYWKKVGSRKAETISKVSMAGAYTIENGRLTDLRIAFGAVGTTVKRSREIEEKFIGLKVDDIEIQDIVNEYMLIVTPIDDLRSTAKYRFMVAMNILKDFLKHLKAKESE